MTVAVNVFGLVFVLGAVAVVCWGCVAYCRAWLRHFETTRPPEIQTCDSHGWADCPLCVGSDV